MKAVTVLLLFVLVALLSLSPSSSLDLGKPKASPYVLDKSPDAPCQINVNGGLEEPQPLILQPGTNKFLYPTSTSGIAQVNEGGQVELYCSDSFAKISAQSVTLRCEGGTKWTYNGASYDFKYFNCRNYPIHVAKRSGQTCFEGARVINVGFEVSGNRFVPVYDVCFDERLERTHYVTHFFTPAHLTFQSAFPRPSGWYFNGYFQGKNVDNLYTRNNQQNQLAKILGSMEQAKKFVPDTTDFFFARGHLAAKSDFIYGTEHRATFWMMNVAPQWQNFNAGNWQRIEDGIKEFVASRNIIVDTYTGTFGTTTLPDVNNQQKEVYLAFDSNNNGLIPAPKIYYKILVNRANDYGIVLIGVNNPYLTKAQIDRDYIFCADVSSRINWIKWNRESITAGYSYACDVNDFFKVVKHLPFLNIKGLLV